MTSDLRKRARATARTAIDAANAELARGTLAEAEWYTRVTSALATAYLVDSDPRWQSGFDGDAGLWREARELVLDDVHRDGSFLDVGCATGHLMECLETWAGERGVRLATYGLELNPSLARAAGERLPEHRERIVEGNVIDWRPSMRFDNVRTGLEYVPGRRRSYLIRRLLRDMVAPGGRLIVGPVPARDLDRALLVFKHAGVAAPTVREGHDRNGKTRYVLWVEKSRG